jgi:hypothetical protein
VNALDPVISLEVAGDPLSIPYQSRLELRPGVLLHAGANEVRVRAVTDSRVHERTFTVTVEALESIAAIPGTNVNEQRILIFRPVERGADVVRPEELLEVGGGAPAYYEPSLKRPLRGALMYPFLVEVSAFSPIQYIKINGQVVAEPRSTWARASAPVVVGPQGAVVEVEAATHFHKVVERFPIGLAATPIPGSPLYLANPPGYVKPKPPPPGEESEAVEELPEAPALPSPDAERR